MYLVSLPFSLSRNTLGAIDWATTGIGLPDMASGKVDVSVAQSGIALAWKMGPIIAENQDKQLGILGKWNQMGYDLVNMWFPAFEELHSTRWREIHCDSWRQCQSIAKPIFKEMP